MFVSNNRNLSLNVVPTIYLVDAYEILCDKKIGYKKDISYLSKQLAINLCSKYSGLPKSALHICKKMYGKPYIVERPDFFFNISHSGRWFGCAVANGHVGFDIQEVLPKYSHLISTKFFSKDEIEYIYSEKVNSNYRFFQLWSAKESYIKCIGTGFNTALRSFTVNGSVIKTNCSNYHVYYPKVQDNYVAAICTKNSINDVKVYYKSICDIL